MLCATILSSQIDCPILLTNKEKINEDIMKELKRLDTEVVYIIGGEDSISEKIVKTIHEEHIYTDRIHGKDRYETSIKLAEKINISKNTDSIILVNGKHSVADAISISPMAGNKNIPVIICKKDNLEIQKKWIKDNNIKNAYIIGGQDVINKDIEDYFYKENIEVERIYGNDRYKTNAEVIKNFYKESKINKLYYCNGKTIDKTDEGIEAMLVVPLAAKEKSPIILLGDKLIKEQREVIKNKNIKFLVQVGNGVSEEAKAELYRIKKSYIPPQPPTGSNNGNNQEVGSGENISPGEVESGKDGNITSGDGTSDDSDKLGEESSGDNESSSEGESGTLGGESPENGATEGTELPKAFKYEEIKISDDKKTITITFNKDVYISNVDLKILKDNIKIIIDKNNIVNNTDNQEKYIKLNKYDKVKINGKSLILELEEAPIGENTYISINTELIKDKEGNLIKDEDGNNIQILRTDSIKGENKKIAFVKNQFDFVLYINNKNQNSKETDIIKLEDNIRITESFNIDLSSNTSDQENKIIIDGSNGEENFKLFNTSTQLKEISMSFSEVIVKNLDINGISIYISNNKNKVVLNNMKIDLQEKDNINKSAILIYRSKVEAKDLILSSNKCGIEIMETNILTSQEEKSILTIDGYVYSGKIYEESKRKPCIILRNRIKDIDSGDLDKLNKIIVKNNNYDINDRYEILNLEEENTTTHKIYEYYYKNNDKN